MVLRSYDRFFSFFPHTDLSFSQGFVPPSEISVNNKQLVATLTHSERLSSLAAVHLKLSLYIKETH